MRTPVRKIGNSRGVLIPAALLAACEIEDTVEMRIEHNRIIIEPVAPQHRKSWFDGSHAETEIGAFDNIKDTAIEQDEWEW